MGIAIRLDRLLQARRMRLTELSRRVGITLTNLSLLKTGKVRAIRFSTLQAICRELGCQPGELISYVPEGADRLPAPPAEPSPTADAAGAEAAPAAPASIGLSFID